VSSDDDAPRQSENDSSDYEDVIDGDGISETEDDSDNDEIQDGEVEDDDEPNPDDHPCVLLGVLADAEMGSGVEQMHPVAMLVKVRIL
jgi:hypothetical protein